MAEYIDRKSLGIGYANPDVFENEAYADGWNAAIKIINESPAADVAEVVRCKDYMFRHTQTCFAKHETADMDFCSCGKRKDGETE